MNARYDVNGVEQTWEVAKAFAAELKPGDVVCLEGDLGAGKTTFTQGVAAALGAKRPVTSPTFCLVVEHPTERLLLVHMDLYRLHDADDVLTIGLRSAKPSFPGPIPGGASKKCTLRGAFFGGITSYFGLTVRPVR